MAADREAMARGDAMLDELAGEYLARDDVDWGRMFSTTGLRVRGKVFALVNHDGSLMVKIPEARADELVAEGSVARIAMRGREMREWVERPADAGLESWRSLLAEAHAYLDEITPR